jgi:hypothetical protein
VRDAPRALLIALNVLLLSAPSAVGSTAASYVTATVLLAVLTLVLVGTWETADPWSAAIASAPPRDQWATRRSALLLATIAAIVLVLASRELVHQILIYPNDAQRADMLIVIQQGIRRVLQGRNPYTLYHVPWEVTLPYGPVMWAPYIIPFVLHADVRFVSLAGELFLPVVCAIVATGAALDNRDTFPAAWLLLVAALTFSPDMRGFTSIAHTPSYWPLIAIFAWLVDRKRWHAAAALCGLLIVARTTMVAIAPVLLMAVWHDDRRRWPTTAAVLAAATVLPYLPFALWDWRALRYALYGSYQSLMKGFVWTSTSWAHNTIGVTGLLLRANLQRFAEAAQVAMMAGVYVACWLAVARGRRPLPWMGLALLAFCMTTLWPVHYIYFDVFLLFAAAALAETGWLRARRLLPVFTYSLAATLVLVAAVAWTSIPRDTAIDIGSPADRPFLYAGFADDEQGDRSFTWVDGNQARILVPRRTRRDATIELVCQPNLPARDSTQTMSVALNGVVLGTVPLHEGWQTLALEAPGRAWIYGVNELTLSFSSAVSPLDAGLGADARKLSAAFDRLTVRTR